MQKIICFPPMGQYTNLFVDLLKEIDLNIMPPPPITSNTIKLGVKHSPDMICYPFKITLGSIIESLNAGATDIIMFNSCGECRLKQYYRLQDLIIKDLNYKFTIHQIRPHHLIKDLKALNHKNSSVYRE